MTNFRKCCVSLPLRVPLSALSFIPHKHMRYGAVLMRTEWTDPRPQRHRGPPPQIHRRYQFSGVLFKRPQCGIQNTSVLCSAIPHKFPQKLLLCLFFPQLHRRIADDLSFYMSTVELFQMPVCWRNGHEIADSAVRCSLIAPWITILVFHLMSSSLLDVWERSHVLWLCSLTHGRPQIILKSQLGITRWKNDGMWKRHGHTCRQWKSTEWQFFIFHHWTG